MKRIEVKLSIRWLPRSLDVIKELAGDLEACRRCRRRCPAVDPELKEAWTAELRRASRPRDRPPVPVRGGLLHRRGGALRPRQCRADRPGLFGGALRLRERYLKPLGDEALEAGEVDLGELPEPVRKAFMCYLFLATIQELIIQHLDESIIES